MPIEQQEIVQLSYALVVILMSLAAALFFRHNPIGTEVEHKTPTRYFTLYFLLGAVAYLVFILRPHMSELISISLNNVLNIAAAYAFFTALQHRINPDAKHMYQNHWFYIHAALVLVLSVGVFYLLIDNFMFRVFLIVSNMMGIYLWTLSYVCKDPAKPSKGENLTKFAIWFTAANILFAMALMLVTADIFIYQAMTVVFWTLQILIMVGALLSMLLSDLIEKHYRESITDPLTGLYNRRYFMSQASILLKSAKRHHFPISIVVCDIDRFKSINDTFGHEIGDKALTAFASIIQQTKRDEDTLARFGGEEFILMLPQTPAEGARQVAERIRQATEDMSLNVPSGEVTFTASFGVSIVHEAEEVDQNIEAADIALYLAKKKGRNQVCVSEDHGDAPPVDSVTD